MLTIPVGTFFGSLAKRSGMLAFASMLLLTAYADASVMTSWTQSQADAKHTGYVGGAIPATKPNQIWSATPALLAEPGFVEGVATDHEHVYLTAYSGQFHNGNSPPSVTRFFVDGAVVPEPSSLTLSWLAVMGIAGLRRAFNSRNSLQ